MPDAELQGAYIALNFLVNNLTLAIRCILVEDLSEYFYASEKVNTIIQFSVIVTSQYLSNKIQVNEPGIQNAEL